MQDVIKVPLVQKPSAEVPSSLANAVAAAASSTAAAAPPSAVTDATAVTTKLITADAAVPTSEKQADAVDKAGSGADLVKLAPTADTSATAAAVDDTLHGIDRRTKGMAVPVVLPMATLGKHVHITRPAKT